MADFLEKIQGLKGKSTKEINSFLAEELINISPPSLFKSLTGISVADTNLDPVGSGELLKEVSKINKLLEKTPLSIPKEKVDALTCEYANEDLYVKVAQEIAKAKTVSPEVQIFVDAATKIKDIDVIGELIKRERAAGRSVITDTNPRERARVLFAQADVEALYLNTNLTKDPQIEGIKEEIFDNIPSLFLGSASKIFEKKLSIKIGPFSLALKVIKESGGTPNVYLDNDLDYENALKNAIKEAQKQQETKVPCEEPKCEDNEKDSESEESIKKKTELLKNLGSQTGKIPPVPLPKPSSRNFLKTTLSPADTLAEVYNGYLEDLKNKEEIKKRISLLDKTGGVLPEDFVCPPSTSPLDPSTSANLFTPKDLENLKKTLCEPEPINSLVEELLGVPSVPSVDLSIKTLEDLQKAIGDSDAKAKSISNCIDELKKQIESVNKKSNDLARYKIAEQKLEELLYYYEIFVSFYEGISSQINDSASDEISIKDPSLLASLFTTGGSLSLYSERLKQFSVLLEGSKFSPLAGNFQFKLFLDTGLGEVLPKTESSVGSNSLFTPSEQVDTGNLKLGHEFGKEGIFQGKPSSFLTPLSKTLEFTKETPPGSDLYGSINLINTTTKSKEEIITYIRNNNGALYSELLERSASPWLFFTQEERGDNNARKPSELEASFYDEEGQPNSRYQEFYNNYDVYWNRKYEEINSLVIAPLLTQIKSDSFSRGKELAGILGGGFFTKRVTELRARREEIKSLLIYSAEQITLIQNSLSAEGIEQSFSKVSCQSTAPSFPQVPETNRPQPTGTKKKRECPPKCCGPAGSAIKKKKFNKDNLSISDCPGITEKCYWKEFCNNATKLGLYPIPSGISPVESPTLSIGVLGLRYWPVGYLPPSFIPLPPPIINPLDGTPFIRIPLPMIWTKVDPIVLPTPLGIIVVFIPFIGGFMPTPLVFFQGLNGVSLFLLGLRGFRFIPRTSDPIIEDPLKKIKLLLTYGIPLPLLPFLINGLFSLDGDSIKDLILEFRANILELFDRTPEPSAEDFEPITRLQDQEIQRKAEREIRVKSAKRKEALEDSRLELENFDTREFQEEKKRALKETSVNYINRKIPAPKNLRFPKNANNLTFNIPGIANNVLETISLKNSLIPTTSSPTYNLRAEIERVTSIVEIPDNPILNEINLNHTGDNKILLIIPGAKDSQQEAIEQVNSKIKEATNLILKGDGVSIDKVKRNGVLDPTNLGRISPQLSVPSVPGGQIDIGCMKLNFDGLDGISTGIVANLPTVDPSILDRFSLPSNLPGQRIIRKKDLRLMLKRGLSVSMDKLEPLISNLPNPGAISLDSIKTLYTNIFSAFEKPPGIPPKVGLGAVQIIVPGRIIKDLIISQLGSLIDAFLTESLPDLLNPNLDTFSNFTPRGLKQFLRDLIYDFLDPNNSPVDLSYLKIPSRQARDQDFSEVLMSPIITPIQKELLNQIWWGFEGVPKIPIVNPETISEISDKIQELLSTLPPVVVVLLGRNIINILNPLIMRDNFPHWKMMSLKNAYFTLYLDEFLRSATDISGAFKNFVGTGQKGLLYPLPGLDIDKGFPIFSNFNQF